MLYDLKTSSSQKLTTGIKKAQNIFKLMSNEKKAKQLLTKNVFTTLKYSSPISLTFWQMFFLQIICMGNFFRFFQRIWNQGNILRLLYPYAKYKKNEGGCLINNKILILERMFARIAFSFEKLLTQTF